MSWPLRDCFTMCVLTSIRETPNSDLHLNEENRGSLGSADNSSLNSNKQTSPVWKQPYPLTGGLDIQATYQWFRNLNKMPQRNEPLMLKQSLGLASGRFGLVFHLVIQQKKGSILRCRPPPSLWTAFVYWQMSMGVQTLLSASLGSLYNVLIDFSLGITDDTSTLARVKKELPHLSL